MTWPTSFPGSSLFLPRGRKRGPWQRGWETTRKSFIFKMFFVHTKTHSQRFQIPPVWKAFSKSSVFVMDWWGPNRRNKDAFSNTSGVVWALPQWTEPLCHGYSSDFFSPNLATFCPKKTDIGKCVASFSTHCNYRAKSNPKSINTDWIKNASLLLRVSISIKWAAKNIRALR